MPNTRKPFFLLVLLIVAGEGIFLLPFVLVRVFRPTYLAFFELTNLELGINFSVYGVVAMASYFFGGPLADRFQARYLISIALWATGAGGFFLVFFSGKVFLPFVYGYWGLTTIFLFWAAMIRAAREWGGLNAQGKAFGSLEAGRGTIAASIATFSVVLFAWLIPDSTSLSLVERNFSFQIVLFSSSLFITLIGVLVWLFMPRTLGENQTTLISASTLGKILKMPVLWIQALIVVSAYVGYKVTDNIPLYAHEVFGLNEVVSAQLGTVVLWMRPVFAIVAGYLADKFRGSTVVIGFFLVTLIFSILLALGMSGWITLTFVSMSFLVAGIFGVRGIYFALMNECHVPHKFSGTAIGIISVTGFTPDVFMTPLMGYFLDTYPGEPGHQYIFAVLGMFSILGTAAGLFLQKITRNSPAITE